jgi:hypothetical protein
MGGFPRTLPTAKLEVVICPCPFMVNSRIVLV